LVPRIVFFGLVAPLNYSSAGSGPSNHLLRASSASESFECGLWSLESSSSGHQRLRIIRVRESVPQIVFFGPAAPQHYSSLGFGPLELHLSAISVFILFGCRSLSFKSLFWAINALHHNTRILVAINQFGCRMSNTKVSPRFATPDGPVFVSSVLCREIFHTYGMKFAPMDASGATQ
jgi:hypothetical protein